MEIGVLRGVGVKPSFPSREALITTRSIVPARIGIPAPFEQSRVAQTHSTRGLKGSSACAVGAIEPANPAKSAAQTKTEQGFACHFCPGQ